MEWNELQYFLAIAKEENISKASDQLFVSQPALSQAVKRLEEELGYPLFHRSGKRIQLNDSGKIFMQTVEEINRLMDHTRAQLEEMNQLTHPNVTINLTAASQLLPKLLSYLKKENPNLQYNIQQWTDPVLSEQADIHIVAVPYSAADSDVPSVKFSNQTDHLLLKEDIVLALPQNHPLLTKECLFLKDLSEEDFICLTNRWELGRETLGEFKHHDFIPKAVISVDNPNIIPELLKAHLGVAFVPAITWNMFAGKDIIFRPVKDFQASWHIYLRTKPYKYQTKELKECMEEIKDFFLNLEKGNEKSLY